MPADPGIPPSGTSVEKMDRAYREANRLVVAAGIVLAGAGVTRSAPVMKALSAALRAVNHGRGLVRPEFPDSSKESDRAHPAAFGRRFRRAAP